MVRIRIHPVVIPQSLILILSLANMAHHMLFTHPTRVLFLPAEGDAVFREIEFNVDIIDFIGNDVGHAGDMVGICVLYNQRAALLRLPLNRHMLPLESLGPAIILSCAALVEGIMHDVEDLPAGLTVSNWKTSVSQLFAMAMQIPYKPSVRSAPAVRRPQRRQPAMLTGRGSPPMFDERL